MKQYIVYAKMWFRFAAQGLRPTIRNIIEFLTLLHNKGYTHDQISAARSAIGVLADEENVGKHPDIKRLMKGVFEKTPSFPRYSCVWDVRVLFDYFRSIPHQRDLPLKLLSKKLATMLGILAGGQRCQTIHLVDILDIVSTTGKCIIPIYSVIKQTKKGRHMHPMEFRPYPTEEKLCFINNLEVYLIKTREVRRSSKLFLSYQKPYNPISKDTITRWVNETLQEAGVDMSKYVTHSCRAAASSSLSSKKVPIRRITEACGWASEETFRRHYKKKVVRETTVAEALLM